LPAEIVVHIAQIAQDEHVKKSSPIHRNFKEGADCPCCSEAIVSKGKHVSVAKEVLALGETSRRIRAVLIYGGFFSTISLRNIDPDELFATSIVATEGLFENAR
jgi:hypothetical protein